jgi:endonuclease/exonuclease/phosphatase family metal-dependent hydrolase
MPLFGATKRDETKTTIKVLLFNVWQLPGFLTDGQSAQRAKAAARLIARSGADVVCLNEAFLRGDQVLSEIVETHPHRAELTGRASILTPLGSGLRVASRVPLAEAPRGVFFRSRAGHDKFASKGVLHVRLDLGGLDLFVTHMQAGCSPAEQASRERQAAEAGAFVRAASGGRPFILAGDLNMSPCATVSPHCATEEDAKCRARAFGELCREAGVRGEAAGVSGREEQPAHEICRFCVGAGSESSSSPSVRLLRVTCLGRRCPDTGAVASDTDALMAEVEVTASASASASGG